MMGSQGIGQITPVLEAFAKGKLSALRIFEVIDRTPAVIINEKNKKLADKLEGEIEIKNVDFTYPAKPDQKILNNISISIKKN